MGQCIQCSQRANILLRLQRKIIKFLFSQFFPIAPNDELFNLTSILKLDLVYLLKIASLMNKVVKLNKPPTLRKDFNLRLPPHLYNTSRNDSFIFPFPGTEATRSNFNYQFTQIWNPVPIEIKTEVH